VEEIKFTATQQWDALLAVATDWARIDNHGDDEPENTDEEEGPFIDDEIGELDSRDRDESSMVEDGGPDRAEGDEIQAESPRRPPRLNNRVLSTPPPVDELDDLADAGDDIRQPATPSTSRVPYATTPLTEKRKRMEELAERRRLKKRL